MDYDSQSTEKMIALIKKTLSPMTAQKTEVTPIVSSLSDIKAILFDIYGTLLISGTGDISIAEERINCFSVDGILKKYGYTQLHPDLNSRHKELFNRLIRDYHEELKSKGIDFPEVNILKIWKDVMVLLLEEESILGELDLETLPFIALEYELMVNPVWPMDGAAELLRWIKQSNRPLGIVSNAQFYTALSIEALFHSDLDQLGFDLELCSWSYQHLKAKPSKEIFEQPLNKLKKLGISPEEVLYMGNDKLNDIYTASLWGCKTALFAGDARSLRWRTKDPRCKDLSPTVVISHLSQLQELLS